MTTADRAGRSCVNRPARIADQAWQSAPSTPGPHVKLLRLSTPTIDALGAHDLKEASKLSDLDLPPFLVDSECQPVWLRRSQQLAKHPQDAAWITRVVINSAGLVIGRAGFHGPPDPSGMVEIGYSTAPDHRRQGYAQAAFLVLLDVARASSSVRTLRATVRPDNFASLALVQRHGLVAVGEQWDEEDGLETILEVDVRAGGLVGWRR